MSCGLSPQRQELNAMNIIPGIIEAPTETQPPSGRPRTIPEGSLPPRSRRRTSSCKIWSCLPPFSPFATVSLDDQLSFNWLWGRHAVNVALLLFLFLFAHAADLLEQMTVGMFVSKWPLRLRILRLQ